MKKRLLILPLLAGFVLTGCDLNDLKFWEKINLDSIAFWKKDEQSEEQQHDEEPQKEDPSVVSVTVTAPSSVGYLGQDPVQFTAEVVVTGNADESVAWSTSNAQVATVSNTGLVTFVGIGRAEIFATSTFDITKYGSLTIEVKDAGPYPELITKYEFEYSKNWPEAELNAFLGMNVFTIEDANGFYFKEYESTEYYDASFMVAGVYTENLASSIINELSNGDYFYYYNSSSDIDCFIDPTQTAQVEVYPNALDEEGTKVICIMDFYRTADKFETSTPTSDTAWEEETAEALADIHADLPFVALGAEYDVYVYSSGMVEISDYCADFTKLDGYDEVLKANGYEENEDGEFVKQLDQYSYISVSYLFNQYGNTIQIYRELILVDEYPGDAVAAFVGEEGIGSKYSVPAFDGNDDYKYTFDTFQIALDEEEEDVRDAVQIDIYNVNEDECMAYLASLLEDGYILDGTYSEYYGSTIAIVHKGKICIQASINYLERPATDEEIAAFEAITEEDIAAMSEDEYYDYLTKAFELAFTGTFSVYDYSEVTSASILIFGDPEGIEDPGIYILDTEVKVGLGSEYTIEPFYWEVDPEEYPVTFESSDPAIATVDENGNVLPVAVGDCVITLTAGDNLYSASVSVHVVNPASINDVMDDVNAWLVEQGGTEQLSFPEIDNLQDIESFYDDYYGCYSIVATISGDQEEAVIAYAGKMAEAGFTVYDEREDDYGFIVVTEETEMQIWYWSDGTFNIDIYYSPALAGDTVDFSEYTETSGETDSFAFETAVGTNANKQAAQYNADSKELRLYIGNTLTISSDEEMTQIFFEANTCTHEKADGTLSASVGTISEVDGGFLWEGSATEVTFTVDSGRQVHINSFTVSFADAE